MVQQVNNNPQVYAEAKAQENTKQKSKKEASICCRPLTYLGSLVQSGASSVAKKIKSIFNKAVECADEVFIKNPHMFIGYSIAIGFAATAILLKRNMPPQV